MPRDLPDRSRNAALVQDVAARQLTVLGGFHAARSDPLPKGTRSVVLLGPAEPGFWPGVREAPEFVDGRPDPLDRWSRRVIGGLADTIGASALFPFDGPPWLPFIDWATRTGRAWTSPVTFLVHAEAGLLLSIRGALALPWRVDLPPPAARPCDSCTGRPCLSACPVAAPGPASYDVAACHALLDRPDGAACLDLGCAARRTCPVSQGYPRQTAQSAFHMNAFHGPR